ncbi:hypothetical protein SAMN05444266_101705 [Chitinophaga jiangningensis]|uniref:Uncharacterized protein n=2 Tax=Chitinophaga jiangningensis TaxID=1419482 RepID=A0A1M6WNH6_9BACT|nr:hypothetical protein SAMN05444266_101705 [Chitinophaga jiangningensis]
MLNVIIGKFLSELYEMDHNAISLVTVTLTVKAEYFPEDGHSELYEVNDKLKAILEKEGQTPIKHYVTCYEM